MEKDAVLKIIEKQRSYFKSGATLSINKRIDALDRLYSAIKENSEKLEIALKADLGKSAFESDMCEINLTLSEISFMKKHVKKYSRTKRVRTPLANFLSSSMQMPSPYGNVLVMSPWNYPVLLLLEPLADLLAAGNTAILKPSAYSPNVSALLSEIIRENFDEEYVAVILGGREENSFLLDQKFDYIFFTGSVAVGKTVMEKASKHLTPVTLELGGKSPVVIMDDAPLKLAAKRLVFGKFLNLGQTCVAPDYVMIKEEQEEEFISYVIDEIEKQLGKDPINNEDYGKIINRKHFDRILTLIDENKIAYGGNSDEERLKIGPTVLKNVTMLDKVMQEEIFGPIMPIIPYKSLDEVKNIISQHPTPLAFYVFTSKVKKAKSFMKNFSFGGGCINDVIVHLATSEMPFGGVGNSGMGGYHGKAGFDTFTHYKSVLDKKNIIDLPIRYQPYSNLKLKLIKLFLH